MPNLYLILTGIVFLLLSLHSYAKRAVEGWQDANGFHYGNEGENDDKDNDDAARRL